MPEPTITFTYNWNGKLCCKCFTTIRLKNDYKYQVNSSYKIMLNKDDIGTGVIRSIIDFKMSHLTIYMALLDMAYPVEQCKEVLLTMYKNRNINWDTQLLSFILIEQPKKHIFRLPHEIFNPLDAEL
jgi:hypothetical protein